jgi:hypothetical protein
MLLILNSNILLIKCPGYFNKFYKFSNELSSFSNNETDFINSNRFSGTLSD